MSNLGNTGSPRSRQVHSQNADERETPEEATRGSKGIRPPAKPSASDRRGPGKDRGGSSVAGPPPEHKRLVEEHVKQWRQQRPKQCKQEEIMN
jgi:hypothetical protein